MYRCVTIMPVFNSFSKRWAFTPKAIESVLLNSTDEDLLLIVDDASSDNTLLEIQNKFPNHPNISYLALSTNVGTATAKKTAINQTDSKWIAFCDDDDVWFKGKTEKQINEIKTKNADFSHCIGQYIDYKDNEIIQKHPHVELANWPEALLSCPFISFTGLLITREAYQKSGGLDNNYYGIDDYSLYLTLFKEKYKLAFINETLYQHRRHSNNTTKLQIIKLMDDELKMAMPYFNTLPYNTKIMFSVYWIMRSLFWLKKGKVNPNYVIRSASRVRFDLLLLSIFLLPFALLIIIYNKKTKNIDLIKFFILIINKYRRYLIVD